jgi:hypothetical protein
MSMNPKNAYNKAVSRVRLCQDSVGTLKKNKVITRMGRTRMWYHLLCENISKKSLSNIRGEGTNSQWGESITFM